MKKVFFCLIFLILCFNLISATETNIRIKTVPFKNVNAIVLSSSLEIYQQFNKDADQYGDVSLLFSSDVSRFDLTIFVKDLELNKKIAYSKLENQIAGEDIYIEVIPEDFTIIKTPGEENLTEEESELNEVENETLNDSLVYLEEESKEKFKISGNAIFGTNTKLRNILIYVLGGIVLLLIAFFIIKIIRKNKRNGKKKDKGIKITKLSDLISSKKSEEQNFNSKNYYIALKDAQKKLEKTEKELNKIKNQEKIREIERKIEKDQQELKRLKRL